MKLDHYTPGYGASLRFMPGRTAETHAAFFLPRLAPDSDVLDVGCGPGSITLGLARRVHPGRAIGVDVEDSQFASAREAAHTESLNAAFQQASAYELPFDDGSFDAVFSHALLGHLSDPLAALREMRRVIRPGGAIGLRATDMGGMLIDCTSEGPARALSAYMEAQRASSKNPNIGRQLGRLLSQAGFVLETQTATYEVITDLVRSLGSVISDIAPEVELERSAESSADESMFVALAWVEAMGIVR